MHIIHNNNDYSLRAVALKKGEGLTIWSSVAVTIASCQWLNITGWRDNQLRLGKVLRVFNDIDIDFGIKANLKRVRNENEKIFWFVQYRVQHDSYFTVFYIEINKNNYFLFTRM